MRIMIIFIDMIRANRHFGFDAASENSKFAQFLQRLGGVTYTNCFTQAPDTPRSLATFYSGLPPVENGCDLRYKWPGEYLKTKDDLFNFLLNYGYHIDFFSNPKERELGLFPDMKKLRITHNNNMDFKLFLSTLSKREKQLTYISLPDFHWAIDDYGATKKGEEFGNSRVNSCIRMLEKYGKLEDYDHVFFYSDHGFKFHEEFQLESRFEFVNWDRTNVIFHHYKRNDNSFAVNTSLTTLTDFFPAFKSLITQGYAFELPKCSHITVEDYYSVAAGDTVLSPSLWAFINNEIYIVFKKSGNYKILWKQNTTESLPGLIRKAKEILALETNYNKELLCERSSKKGFVSDVKTPTTYSDKTPRPGFIEKFIWRCVKKIIFIKKKFCVGSNTFVKKSCQSEW